MSVNIQTKRELKNLVRANKHRQHGAGKFKLKRRYSNDTQDSRQRWNHWAR